MTLLKVFLNKLIINNHVMKNNTNYHDASKVLQFEQLSAVTEYDLKRLEDTKHRSTSFR